MRFGFSHGEIVGTFRPALCMAFETLPAQPVTFTGIGTFIDQIIHVGSLDGNKIGR
jgi:hypothetical protein